MIKRIELILKTQNLTPSQLADRLGVQRSGMSHILSGRNKPSLDFVMKVLSAFPEINANWLLFGTGKMYAEMTDEKPEPELAFEPVQKPVSDDVFAFAPEPEPEPESEPAPESEPEPVRELPSTPNPAPYGGVRASSPVSKIVCFYADGTFKEYRPLASDGSIL